MKNLLALTLFGAFWCAVKAQTPTTPTTQPYGKVDIADLELKSCDFEKDANAEVLFDKAKVSFDIINRNYNRYYTVGIQRHKRIKIFNDHGKDEADVRIEYYSVDGLESIYDIQAETINLNNGVPEITKLDKKQIYTQRVDKERRAIVFSFPNVKPGSIIEFKYFQRNESVGDFPNWYFQGDIPTRYSELTCDIPFNIHYKNLVRSNQPFVKNQKDKEENYTALAMANVPSLPNEPYMTSRFDNLQCVLFQLLNVNFSNDQESWEKIGERMCQYTDFGDQIKRKVKGEDVILAQAKTLKTDEEKIAYIFTQVRNTVKWNNIYAAYTEDGTSEAWDKKAGNSTEINLILNHLLNKAGVKSYPLSLSTRKNGKVNPGYPSRYQFNTTAAYVPVDSAHYYVLDATNKYNSYKDIPSNLLNSFGLCIDKENKKYDLVFVQNTAPARNIVIINADVKTGGKMNGTAQINSFSYHRINSLDEYNTDGEKKYIDYLREDDNNLKISSLKLENMEVDSLPLIQNVSFDLDLTSSDDNYIYFKPNLFTSLKTNPFLSENRSTDIDFGYRNSCSIVGNYKIPVGYKLDFLPKSITMVMPDQTVSFRRLVAEDSGTITVRYVISYQKPIFFKENYDELRDFYKKMYEMLNEQVVLKKS